MSSTLSPIWIAISASLLAACAKGPATSPRSGAEQREAAAARGVPLTLNIARLPARAQGERSKLLETMRAELDRSMAALGQHAETAPYFIAYQVIDQHGIEIEASLGGLVRSEKQRWRSLDADVRVGSPELDNRHPLRGQWDAAAYYTHSAWLPIENDLLATSVALWLTTHEEHRRAVEELVRVRANRQVKVDETDASADFSRQGRVSYLEPPTTLDLSPGPWEDATRRLSARFRAHPDIHESSVGFEASAETRYLTTSEGSDVQVGLTRARVVISASTTASDGMRLDRHEIVDARTSDRLPSEDRLVARAQQVIDDLLALRAAPIIEPFAGPAILDGRAAAVFFHEIFGHRVEGHRQKDEEEGQTFTGKLGQPVMPRFLTVYDDPAIATLNGIDLSGYYPYDDEGVAAGRAMLVENGVLRGFLMSRSPIEGFDRSNGHGRRQRGHRVVSRQANLVVHPSRTLGREGLKRRLLEEIRRQNKPFGLRFSEITGGYTNTTRAEAQAFKVLPVMVYKIYPNGREELVRGADLEGTPLSALSHILAAGDDVAVFNGMCGAESGWVPVSAVSPSLLVSQIEVARRERAQERPPLLPAPPLGEAADRRGAP